MPCTPNLPKRSFGAYCAVLLDSAASGDTTRAGGVLAPKGRRDALGAARLPIAFPKSPLGPAFLAKAGLLVFICGLYRSEMGLKRSWSHLSPSTPEDCCCLAAAFVRLGPGAAAAAGGGDLTCVSQVGCVTMVRSE